MAFSSPLAVIAAPRHTSSPAVSATFHRLFVGPPFLRQGRLGSQALVHRRAHRKSNENLIPIPPASRCATGSSRLILTCRTEGVLYSASVRQAANKRLTVRKGPSSLVPCRPAIRQSQLPSFPPATPASADSRCGVSSDVHMDCGDLFPPRPLATTSEFTCANPPHTTGHTRRSAGKLGARSQGLLQRLLILQFRRQPYTQPERPSPFALAKWRVGDPVRSSACPSC